jgi:pSer/pThr/pTyr-binding forkhead associated (FHA) protein
VPEPAHYEQPPPPHSTDGGATRIGSVPVAAHGRLVGVLIATEGEDLVGEVFRLYDGENKLGRGKDCSVKMTSEFISREHALLIHQEGVFAIRPLKDENPVLVNGERTEGSALQDGDLVRLGRTTFRFRTA